MAKQQKQLAFDFSPALTTRMEPFLSPRINNEMRYETWYQWDDTLFPRYQHDTSDGLHHFDIILINTSAGKDSLAMLDAVCAEAKRQGVLDRVIAVHADLGRVEWDGTRELAERQAAKYGIRFEVVSRPQGDLLDQVEERGMWPSSSARYCTSDQKRGQVAKLITSLTKEVEAENVKILNCMGLRADESSERAKRHPYTLNARSTNSKRTVYDWLPIHHWSEDEVWTWIRSRDLEYHYAYDLGMERLSCVFCIFAPADQLQTAARHNPELLAEYVRVERKISHTFQAHRSLEESVALYQVEAA